MTSIHDRCPACGARAWYSDPRDAGRAVCGACLQPRAFLADLPALTPGPNSGQTSGGRAQPSDAMAHEIWAAAQCAPGDGIEDAVSRIMDILRAAMAEPSEAVSLLRRARQYVDQDAQMMADITRHSPLDAEWQARHDSTEYESERLLREIDALLAAMAEGAR